MMVVRRILLWGGTAVLFMGIVLILAQAFGPELLDWWLHQKELRRD